MLRDVEGEKRVLDTDLAVALGMARPTDIRELIERNINEINELGFIRTARENHGGGRGRPGTAYYLNEEQAIFVATLSRTPTARRVHVEVVKVYAAWRKCQTYERPRQGVVLFWGSHVRGH